MSAKSAIPFLVAMMLLTGVCNTLLTKYQVRSPSCFILSTVHLHMRITGLTMRAQLRLLRPQAAATLRATGHPDVRLPF